MLFSAGEVYSRQDIRQVLGGGDIQSYLISMDGKIVAGCFVPSLNPNLPNQVFVGHGNRRVSRAIKSVEQNRPIPCFVKDGNKAYKYLGVFRPSRFDQSEEAREMAERLIKGQGVAGVLHLEFAG